MINKFSLFSFFILSCFYIVVSSEIYLDCYFSKYLLYNLNTKVMYFNKNLLVHTSNQNLVEKFAMGLQTLGPIVIVMLQQIDDEYKKINRSLSPNRFKNSQGLLYANFYLNNLSNTLLLQTYQNVTIQTRELSDHEIFIDEFKKIYPMLIEQLKKNVLDACYEGKQLNFPDIVIQNQFVGDNYSSNAIIDDLLPNEEAIKTIFMEENIENTMNKVNDSEVNLRYHFNLKIEDEIPENTSYHPNNILFSSLFDKSIRSKLSEIIEVPINEKLENGKYPNMAVLFDMIKHTFDVDCVESFQRQVVAATVYPVYYCVGKFALLLQKIYDSVNVENREVISRDKLYGKQLKKTAGDIKLLLNCLMYNNLPKKVKKHVEITDDLLEKIMSLVISQTFFKLKSGFIHRLYWRCAEAMKLNLIHFDTGVDKPNMYDQVQCDKILSQINFKISPLLANQSSNNLLNKALLVFYSDGREIFSFDEIFSKELKCNIVQLNKQGYHIIWK
ncbi:uncharacterized protein LOC126905198 isoform X4 [Daktulosphaira vitifoliae]|uniref:uncharacterized protein LOC126905198 isoform X4 n=1 Tax=Daktulosphaira vitifoliae TaxID=58002 RepID=UPI0021A99F8B|nr:uncharacterized protein LOC126905198 isoform X4 [Daktulosphaira vitifoliae]